MAERRYQVKSDAANRLILELLDVADVPLERRGVYQQLLITVLKLHDDEALVGDLRIANDRPQGAPLRLQGLRAVPRTCAR